jgi:hypothetical protein
MAENPTIKNIFNTFDKIEDYCEARGTGPSLYVQRGRVRYNAPFSDFITDIITQLGAYGEGMRYRDFGINVLGSFVVDYTLIVDCDKCTKEAAIYVWNQFTSDSLTRDPISKKSTPLKFLVYRKATDIIIKYHFKDHFPCPCKK